MSDDWFHVENQAEIPSPALLIFRERAERNIRLMIEIAGGPSRLRPHVKTHKLAPLVQLQRKHGITKFKCATIAEGEMTAGAGATDVLLAFPPVGPAVNRLIELQQRFPGTHFCTIADNDVSVRALGAAAAHAGLVLEVLLDLNCGMHRTGIVPGSEATGIYRLINETAGLIPGGLHAYDGHIHELDVAARTAQCDAAFAPVIALRDQLIHAGLPVPRLVVGGAPTFAIHAHHLDRELSPGTTVLWDFGYAEQFPDLPFEAAALLLTRVVSKPGRQRLCLDLGYKAVASESPPPRVRLLELPDASAVVHSEEHLVIETPRAGEFQVGATLHALPLHICPTVALYHEAWVVEDGAARERWPIEARARRLKI